MGPFLRVKVHPGAKEDRLIRKGPDAYEAWVRAKPERGLANAAVALILSRELGLEPKKLRLIKGATAPSKIFQVLGQL